MLGDFRHLGHLDANRPASITDPFNATVQYTYDAAGNRTSLTYPNLQSAGYVYDPANRLVGVNDWTNTVTSYQYDSANRLTAITRPNGVNTTYQYNANSWLQSITHAAGVEPLASHQYQYDNVGNRIQAIENVPAPTLLPTPTPTLAPTETSTPTPTETPTGIPTDTPTPTDTPIGYLPAHVFAAPAKLPSLPKINAGLSSAFLQSGPSITIDYTYDPLYHLTEANYSTGAYYQYTYDAVGNGLTQQTTLLHD